ncbi:MAG TPA: hypothetical protein VKR58_11935 [Aquella sp.]|nr:hypothetical protein [Aquella sp.]
MTPEITPEMKSNLKSLLIRHEALKKYPYTDTVGKITIGIGRNISDEGLSLSEIDILFFNDVDCYYQFLSSYPWFKQLNEARQLILIDMCFMGIKHFQEFREMIKALNNRDYETAAQEVLNSEYAKEVHGRANDIAEVLRTGEISWITNQSVV